MIVRLWCLTVLAVAFGTDWAAAKDDGPKTYTGFVSGIEVVAEPGKPVVCLAYVSEGAPANERQIQVMAPEGRIQSVLELSTLRRIPVEVTYVVKDGVNVLTRVRTLDRNVKGGANK
jgi:hypothetical protein